MKIRNLLLLAFALLSLPALALAQDAAPTVDSTLAAVVTALVPVVVMLIVWGVRELLPNIPPIVLPILATSLGAALNLIQAAQGVTGGSLLRGAALGALAVFVREVLTTLGVNVSVSKT